MDSDLYTDGWLIPKLSYIQQGSRLTAERVNRLKIGDGITLKEREILLEVLFNREAAIAFDFTQKGVFKEEIEPPHRIPTVPPEPWQVPSFHIPKALMSEVTKICEDRLQCGTLEPSFGPYRNPWFLVKKKNGKYRLIVKSNSNPLASVM